MEMADLLMLAEEHLPMRRTDAAGPYAFADVRGGDMRRFGGCVFDDRTARGRLSVGHLGLVLLDQAQQRIAGNASIFIIGPEAFQDVRFWREGRVGGRSRFTKISLSDIPTCGCVDRVVMHGYVRSPSVTRRAYGSEALVWAAHKYVRFLGAVAALCASRNVPMLVEPIGTVTLMDEVHRSELNEADLHPETRAAVGRTRPASRATEKLARLLGLDEVPHVFGERTLGKVFLSVPRPERRCGARLSLSGCTAAFDGSTGTAA